MPCAGFNLGVFLSLKVNNNSFERTGGLFVAEAANLEVRDLTQAAASGTLQNATAALIYLRTDVAGQTIDFKKPSNHWSAFYLYNPQQTASARTSSMKLQYFNSDNN